MQLEKLLKNISLKDYQDFILTYCNKNPEFKTEFEVYFADKDENIDLHKKYSEWIKKTIRKYEYKGFIDYKNTRNLAGELQDIIDAGSVLVKKQNFLGAFEIAKVALKETMTTLSYCDDSSGSLGGTVEYAIELLDSIINNPNTARPLKEQLFEYLKVAVKDDVYFDYGGFGYHLLDLFEDLAIKMDQPETYIEHLDNQLSKPYSDYKKNYYRICKIEFLTAIGRPDQVEELVAQSMDIVEIRQTEVNKAISAGNYESAKDLINEGISIAKEKNHPGTVSIWQNALLRIAFLEKDIQTIRHYCKYFAFDRGFNQEYYRSWKESFLADEWTEVIEVHIQKLIDDAFKIFNKNKSNNWGRLSQLALLSTVASIYIEENYLDRLFELVKQEQDLDCILEYHNVLVKDFALDLIPVYLPAIKESGINASDRKQYQDFVKKIRRIIKDIPQGTEQIINIAKELRATYYRRPAMVEELNKLIQS
jgi:hypothetical protein